MRPAAERTSTSRRKRSRDPRWDNLRWLAGTLVVFMHAADTITDRDGLRWLHIATWAMRVPMLALLAGYFSSAEPLTLRRARHLAESIAVPYLAIVGLQSAEVWMMSHREWPNEIPGPAWSLWFLLSLLTWRAALPLLSRLPHPLATSVVAALVSGYIPALGLQFSAARTLGFLPFFLLGWKLRQGALAGVLSARWSRRAAAAVLGAAFAVSWWLRDRVDLEALKLRGPYGEGGLAEAPWAWTDRGAILACGAAVALSVIRLAPRRRIPFVTALGTGGMFMYLLHPLVIRPVEAAFAVDWVGSGAEQLLLLLLSAALAAALASPPVRLLAAPLVRPRPTTWFAAVRRERTRAGSG
ncbi:acyltransferase family protein [Streptomyces johnsoniae]|uniref:Acyltransferase family protein n=1 Tax=Streptomyces johnsoniae TaxID=3075532 RepID=A0ABU2S172_9ACTN|nr:acyltransferase family protein [Streptomyces sp. DSM 41886]MDT0441830.1 acyltransferase family protein [Streptomyces sp. DSM 41886]